MSAHVRGLDDRCASWCPACAEQRGPRRVTPLAYDFDAPMPAPRRAAEVPVVRERSSSVEFAASFVLGGLSVLACMIPVLRDQRSHAEQRIVDRLGPDWPSRYVLVDRDAEPPEHVRDAARAALGLHEEK